MEVNTIKISNPFNAHVHFRTGELLKIAAPYTARQFWGAIVMPNLKPPITTIEGLTSYYDEIVACTGKGEDAFRPFLTLYLTEGLTCTTIKQAFERKLAIAVKYYPRGATTNSEEGIRDIEKIFPQLEVMEEIGMSLLMHGEEVVDDLGEETDPYDREKLFIDRVYRMLQERFPRLKISLEHISTQEGAELAREVEKTMPPGQYQFTVCPQHLLFDRRDVMRDGNQADLTCMPRIKRKEHKEALRGLIAEGLSCVALGSDDAIHPERGKLRATGCNCGCFTSPYCLELYAQVFDEMHALQHFEAFAAHNALRFFNLDPPSTTILVTLVREEWRPKGLIPIPFSSDYVRPLGCREDTTKGIVLKWKMVD